MRQRRRLASGLGGSAALLLGGAAGAQFDSSPFAEALNDSHVSVRLISDADPIGPGQTFYLAVRFNIEKKWHMYWKNPGEGAMPPGITLATPPGYAAGDVLWPRPVAVTTPLGREYCYFDELVLFVPITTPESLPDDSVTLHVDIQWTVCRQACLMGAASRDITIATSSRRPADAGTNGVLAAFKKRLPKPLADLKGAEIAFDGKTLTVTGPAGAAKRAAFFPVDGPGVAFGAAEAAVGDGRFRVVVPVILTPLNARGGPVRLGGLVTLGEEADDPSYDFEIPLDDATSPGSP